MGWVFIHRGLLKATAHFLPELNFPLALLSAPVMLGKIVFAAFSQLIRNCVPLFSKLKHQEILRIELWHRYCCIGTESMNLPWFCLDSTEGWTQGVHHLSLQTQLRQDQVQDEQHIAEWAYLTRSLLPPSVFSPSETQVSPVVHSLQAQDQLTVCLVYNLPSAFSHLLLIFNFSLPPAWLSGLFPIPSSYFSVFSVTILATVPTNSSQFPQSHFFISPSHHLILVFFLLMIQKSHIWRLSLSLRLIAFDELSMAFLLLEVGAPSGSSHEDGRWGGRWNPVLSFLLGKQTEWVSTFHSHISISFWCVVCRVASSQYKLKCSNTIGDSLEILGPKIKDTENSELILLVVFGFFFS